MSASREQYYKVLFLVAAVYDISLGIVFTFFVRPTFELLGIVDMLPQHGAYTALIGAFLFVIGVAYALVAGGDLAKNRDLVAVGALYKLAYCAVAFYYFSVGQVPHMVFVSLFGVADLVFFALMLECYFFLAKPSPHLVSAA